jgi:hypothetical protein
MRIRPFEASSDFPQESLSLATYLEIRPVPRPCHFARAVDFLARRIMIELSK